MIDIATTIIKKVNTFLESDACMLPVEGLLTGQAVACLYLQEIGAIPQDKLFKINDIDVFEISSKCNQHRVVGTRNLATDLNTICGAYGGLNVTTTGSYDILSTRTLGVTGLLNITSVIPYIGSNEYQKIIESFDINSTQFGIDLATKTIIATSAFHAFAKTLQLKVANFSTPAHTALRLCKKADELGFWCDLDLEIAKCAETFTYANNEKFGKKYMHVFKQYKTAMRDSFTLSPMTLKSGDVIYCVNEFTRAVPKHYEERFELFRALLSHFIPTFDCGTMSRLASICFDRSLKHAKQLVAELLRVDRNGNECALFFYMRHINEQPSLPRLKSVCNIFNQHPYLVNRVTELESLEMIYKWSDYLKSLSKTHSTSVFGIAENTALNEYTPESFGKLVSLYHKNSVEALRDEPALCFNASGFIFKELIDSKSLVREGEEMSHCVGGYAIGVHEQRCRIFSCKHETDDTLRATVELRLFSDSIFMRQAMHKGNQCVSKELKVTFRNALVNHGIAIESFPPESTWQTFDLEPDEIPF